MIERKRDGEKFCMKLCNAERSPPPTPSVKLYNNVDVLLYISHCSMSAIVENSGNRVRCVWKLLITFLEITKKLNIVRKISFGYEAQFHLHRSKISTHQLHIGRHQILPRATLIYTDRTTLTLSLCGALTWIKTKTNNILTVFSKFYVHIILSTS